MYIKTWWIVYQHISWRYQSDYNSIHFVRNLPDFTSRWPQPTRTCPLQRRTTLRNADIGFEQERCNFYPLTSCPLHPPQIGGFVHDFAIIVIMYFCVTIWWWQFFCKVFSFISGAIWTIAKRKGGMGNGKQCSVAFNRSCNTMGKQISFIYGPLISKGFKLPLSNAGRLFNLGVHLVATL